MKYYHSFFLLLFVFIPALLLAGATCYGVEATDTIASASDMHWERITGDEVFSYRTETESTPRGADVDMDWLDTVVLFMLSFLTSGLGKFIIWLLFFMLLGSFLFKLFFKTSIFGSLYGKRRTPAESTDDLETDLLLRDWELPLQKAMDESDHPLVIKYSYIYLLQLLQQKGLLQYRQDKTNRDYYYELKGTDFARPFRQMANLYEYVHYGNYPTTAQQYEDYLQLFHTTKAKLVVK